MKIKILALTSLVSSTLLLTGCGGGGGGSAATQTTVIDGFNMTEGTADAKLGATYIQEILTAAGSSTTVSTMYSRIDLTGLEAAHSSGWTGKGKTITVLDGDSFDKSNWHGKYVSDIARFVAPGASRNEYILSNVLTDSSKNITTIASDIITTSVGYTPSAVAANGTLASNLDDLVRDMEGSSALVTVAAQHSNWSGTGSGDRNYAGNGGFTDCPVSGTMTISNCNTWSIDGLDSSNVIYVGEVNSSDSIPDWSNQAGSTHKNQFIVTSSDEVTTASDGTPSGNSYAAPRVAGVGALVRHKFPNLSGSQTATVILHTADDLGATGVDAVYGHGKLNVGKTLAPVGNLH